MEYKIIDLTALSEEARGILVKAIPHQRGGFTSEDKDYYRLYNDFQKATNYKYMGEGSFNKFQVAVEGMRRRQRSLNYKGDLESQMLKGRSL